MDNHFTNQSAEKMFLIHNKKKMSSKLPNIKFIQIQETVIMITAKLTEEICYNDNSKIYTGDLLY